MANFKVEKILPTPRNAVDMPEMTRSELLARLGTGSHDVLRKVPDPSEQLEALSLAQYSPTLRYWGATDESGRLLAFIKTNEFFYDDQVAYESAGKQILYKFRLRRQQQPLPDRPRGVFALTSHRSLSYDAALEASELLLDAAIGDAGGKEMRMGNYARGDDPARWAAIHKGFSPTGKFGFVLDTLQELYIRPQVPKTPESDAETS